MVDHDKQQSTPETIKIDEIKVEKMGNDYGSEQTIDTDLRKIDDIIDDYNSEKGFLVSILQDIQEEYDYLSREALIRVSERLNLPLIQVYRVAAFFDEFNLKQASGISIGNEERTNTVKKDYLSKFTKNRGF